MLVELIESNYKNPTEEWPIFVNAAMVACVVEVRARPTQSHCLVVMNTAYPDMDDNVHFVKGTVREIAAKLNAAEKKHA